MGGEFEAGEQVFSLQVRKFGQQIFEWVPAGKVFEDGLSRQEVGIHDGQQRRERRGVGHAVEMGFPRG